MFVSHVWHPGNFAMSQTCKQLILVETKLSLRMISSQMLASNSDKIYITKSLELSVALCVASVSLSKSPYCQFTNLSELNSFILLILLQFFYFFTELNQQFNLITTISLYGRVHTLRTTLIYVSLVVRTSTRAS